jgi:phosphotransferase system  glucose/maltose/N-acetylglucosamine-specific IIC component
MPTPPSSAPPPQHPLFIFDPKTIQTIQWSAIANAVAAAISGAAGHVASRLAVQTVVTNISGASLGGAYGDLLNASLARSGAYAFSVRQFVASIVWGAVYGAIGGWALAKFFPFFLRWNQQFLQGKLNSFFKLLFYPTIVAALLLAVLGTVASFLTGFSSWIVMIVGLLVSRFAYAKLMDAKVGHLYPVK